MIKKQKRAAKPGINRLSEGRVARRKVAERRNTEFRGVAFLIENELEKAEIVLNAKSITDKLQSMAEDLAKVEADDLMPMLDAMRETFGAQQADSFNNAVTEKVRELMNAVKGAKDAIGNEIMRLEGEVTGEAAPDMSMDADSMGAPAGGADMGDEAEMGDESDDDAGDEMDLGGDAEEAPADDEDDNDGEDDPFASILGGGGDMGNAAGRAKKESVAYRSSPLARSTNPDRRVLESFRRRLAETKSPRHAMISTARFYRIDVDEVLRIVKEAQRSSKRAVTEMVSDARKAELKKMGYAVNTDGKGHRWVKPKTGTNANTEQMRAPAKDENMAWADLDKHVKMSANKPAQPMQEAKGKKPDADKDGLPDWADKNPKKKAPPFVDRKKANEAAVAEAKRKAKKDGDPCWKGYEMVGMKKKGGKEVPNCVPTSEGARVVKNDPRTKHVKDMALDAGIHVSHIGNSIYVKDERDAAKLRSVLKTNPALAGFDRIYVD